VKRSHRVDGGRGGVVVHGTSTAEQTDAPLSRTIASDGALGPGDRRGGLPPLLREVALAVVGTAVAVSSTVGAGGLSPVESPVAASPLVQSGVQSARSSS
jgi:hypothetical protein